MYIVVTTAMIGIDIFRGIPAAEYKLPFIIVWIYKTGNTLLS